jgi:hypothetical protein
MKPLRLDNQRLERLLRSSGERMISIAIPTHARGREVSQDRIQLKNQLAEVDSVLENSGVRSREREDQLAEVTALLGDVEFWEHQSEQLAVYIDDAGETTAIAVSEQTKARPTVVSTVFHLRHVLGDLNPVRLPVLVLTENVVALYEVSSGGVTEQDVDLPSSFEDVNWFVDRERQRQQHPDRVGSKSNRHGHDPTAKEGEDTARFLRAVRDALPVETIGEPLVVLGGENLVNRFESLSGGEILSPEHSGIDDLSTAAIYERAVPELERYQRHQVADLSADALDDLGVGNATTDLFEALSDAAAGRLSRVLLHSDADPVWGDFDPESLVVNTCDDQEYGAVDLIDRLIATAYGTGAEIILSDSNLGGNDLVAVRRF